MLCTIRFNLSSFPMCKNSGTFSSFLCFQVLDECLTRIHALKVGIWPSITSAICHCQSLSLSFSITSAICDSQVAGEDPQRIGIMVASHNEDTVRFKFQYFRDGILIKRLFLVLRTLSWLGLVASSKPPRGLCVIEITIFPTLFFSGSLWSWPYGRAWSWPPGNIYCFFFIIWIRAKLFDNGILASSAYTTFSYILC